MKRILGFFLFLILSGGALVFGFTIWQYNETGTCRVDFICGQKIESQPTTSSTPALALPKVIEDIPTITKYLLTEVPPDRCGCTYQEKPLRGSKFDAVGDSPAPNLDLKSCLPYAESAALFGRLSDVRSCSSFLLKGSDGKAIRHITLSYGPGQDCPAGCFYNTASFIYDETESKTTYQFQSSYYELLGTISRKNGDWDRVLKIIAEMWFSETRQALMSDGDGHTLRPFCRPFKGDLKPYLGRVKEQYVWAVDLPTTAECSVKFWPHSGASTVVGVDITGTLVDAPINKNNARSYDLKYLNFSKIPNLDRSVEIEDLVKYLHNKKFKMTPKFFNPKYPEQEEGSVELVNLEGNEVYQVADFPFYSSNAWLETPKGLYWIRLYSGLWRMKFDNMDSQEVAHGSGLRKFFLSPDENKVLLAFEYASRVRDLATGEMLTVTGDSNSHLEWINDSQFKVNDSKPLVMSDLKQKIRKCHSSLKLFLSKANGTKQFTFSIWSQSTPAEFEEMFGSLKIEKKQYAPVSYDFIFTLKDESLANQLFELLQACPLNGTVRKR